MSGLPRELSRIEKIVYLALEQSAADYSRDRGRFVPFAQRRICEALIDYEKVLRHMPRELRVHAGQRRLMDGKLNIAAFRRGLMMT